MGCLQAAAATNYSSQHLAGAACTAGAATPPRLTALVVPAAPDATPADSDQLVGLPQHGHH